MTAPSASTVSRWTTPADIESKVRRRWDDGSLLRDYASDRPFPVIEVPLRGPQPSTIGDDVSAVREWVARPDAGRRDDRRYALQWQAVGGRHFGRNQLPTRAVVTSYDQAWSLLGVREAVSRFDEVLRVADSAPAVRDWVIGQPHRALQLHDDLPRLLAAYEWLDAHRGSGRYLREISAPGVDTKFAERHRAVLAAMLGVPSTSGGFLAGLGLRPKPDYVRLRPSASLGLTPGMSELALRAGELADLPIRPRTAFVVENEITYLAVDVPAGGMVLWGKGFDVDRVGRLPWLADVEVVYWGDIDTHGFAILDRLRAWLPQTRSVLMDRATLLAHRDRWVEEDRPTRAALSRLTEDERGLYEDLVTDAFGQRVRLEQEVVDWGWVGARSHGRNRGGFTP
ncbi:MAG: Wadjet anti-phage system protein JetD domain-containing protein [Actinomycetales bacterium]